MPAASSVRDGHAREHQHEYGIVAAHAAGHQRHETHGEQAAREGGTLHGDDRPAQEDASRAPKPAPADTPRMSGDTSGLRNIA